MSKQQSKTNDEFHKRKADDFDRKWAHIIKKTASDQAFKQRLLNNPQQVLKENGIEFSREATIKIHENSPKVIHLVLPETQVAREFSEEELRKVAGGRMNIVWYGEGVNRSRTMGTMQITAMYE